MLCCVVFCLDAALLCGHVNVSVCLCVSGCVCVMLCMHVSYVRVFGISPHLCTFLLSGTSPSAVRALSRVSRLCLPRFSELCWNLGLGVLARLSLRAPTTRDPPSAPLQHEQTLSKHTHAHTRTRRARSHHHASARLSVPAHGEGIVKCHRTCV